MSSSAAMSSAGAHARGRCAQCSAPRAAAQGLGAAGAGCGAGGGTSADASRGGVRGPSVAGKKTSSQKCCFMMFDVNHVGFWLT